VLPILAFSVKNFRGNTILRCNLFTASFVKMCTSHVVPGRALV
jgi:hypothetical protein